MDPSGIDFWSPFIFINGLDDITDDAMTNLASDGAEQAVSKAGLCLSRSWLIVLYTS